MEKVARPRAANARLKKVSNGNVLSMWGGM
jgi:hypothetical protein